jgi:hypothetical protein
VLNADLLDRIRQCCESILILFRSDLDPDCGFVILNYEYGSRRLITYGSGRILPGHFVVIDKKILSNW